MLVDTTRMHVKTWSNMASSNILGKLEGIWVMDVDQVKAYNLNHVLEKQKTDPETLNAGEGHWTPAKYYTTRILGQREKEKGAKQPMRCLPKDRKSFWQLLCQEELCSLLYPLK